MTGIGFYIHLHWIVMALLVSLAVFGDALSRKPRQWRGFFFFLLPLLFLALPLLVAGYEQKADCYLSTLWSFKKGFNAQAQWTACREYFEGLFWGVQTSRFCYKPFWGGDSSTRYWIQPSVWEY